jgi:hypothetical protein
MVRKDSTTNGPFWTFWLLYIKDFFCNMFLKIVTFLPINYITCVNFFWINMKILKTYKFSQILFFVLKNDHNFKSYKNMIITLSFNFLYHKSKLCSYVIQIMTHLHLANDSWNLKFLKLYFEFLKISSVTILKLWVFFICGWVGYHHFKKNSHQNFFDQKSVL